MTARVHFARWRGVLSQTVAGWNAHRSFSESAALAFYTLFSFAPILIVTITIAGAIFGTERVRSGLVRQFAGLMGKPQAELIRSMLERAPSQERGIAALLGGAILLVGASAVFVQLQSSLNRVWEVEPRRGHLIQSLLQKRLASFAMLLGIGFLLVVSLAFSAGADALQDYAIGRFAAIPAPLFRGIRFAGTLFLFAVLFAMIYRVLPDREIEWKDVWLGAFVASAAFQLGKWFFALYIGGTGLASPYGAAGALVIILFWIFYTCSMLLLGAEFTRAHSRTILGSHPETTPGAHRVKEVKKEIKPKAERT
jgi:membrane protein